MPHGLSKNSRPDLSALQPAMRSKEGGVSSVHASAWGAEGHLCLATCAAGLQSRAGGSLCLPCTLWDAAFTPSTLCLSKDS